MALFTPGKRKASVENLGSQLRISIPSSKNVLMIVFLCFWLGGWYMGESMAMGALLKAKTLWKPENLFLVFWLCGWTVGGGFAISFVGWMLFGKEIITASADRLIIAYKALGLGLQKEYRLSEANNFRIFSDDNNKEEDTCQPMPRTLAGKIAFDYNTKTIRFAAGIDSVEAASLLERLKERCLIRTQDDFS